ncbi:MAG TPA: hypothetical protein VMY05_10430 [Acidobacteriota bacterium]|nr:hypothetical protein [Acidobacteriota bacterium]
MSGLVVIDFSDTAASSTEKDAGHKQVVCKFMLLSVSGLVHLVFGSVKRFAYHADLVDRFCTERGIAAVWMKRPDVMEVFDPEVRLLGGGWMKINRARSEIDIYGRSTAYGRFDDAMIERVTGSDSFFASCRVRIR